MLQDEGGEREKGRRLSARECPAGRLPPPSLPHRRLRGAAAAAFSLLAFLISYVAFACAAV
jgi:hypothetical protein